MRSRHIIGDAQFGPVRDDRVTREELYIIRTHVIVVILAEVQTELSYTGIVNESQIGTA